MKLSTKFIIALCALLSAAIPARVSAQASVEGTAEITEQEVFNPHWFIQPQVGAAYTIGETKFADLISPAAAISAGYRFTPAFGLRVGVSGWQARGSWVAPRHDYKFNYLQGNVDAMLSFTNLFCGFNPDRVLDFYGFIGAGAALGFHNKEAVALANAGCGFEKLWTGKKLFPAGRAGLGLDINLSRLFALNVEVNANALPDKFNSKKGSKADWQYNALVGVTYSFGGRSKKVVKAEETIIVEEPAPAPEPAPEPIPEPTPAPEPVKAAPAPMTQHIFFTLNSSKITRENQIKVDALVEYMKANPETSVTVTGYADKATGTSPYNMKLSMRRAQAVAAALKAAGISESRITVDAKGDTEQPFAEIVKNRVAIAITH